MRRKSFFFAYSMACRSSLSPKPWPRKSRCTINVFEQDDKAAFRRADREEQIDHPEDHAVLPQDENAAAIGLFEDQPQAAHLLRRDRAEIALLREQIARADR